jgi:glycosyltransferase involved in cell wall biosynthesis
LRLFTQEHGGQARARNLALTKATGEYVAFVDGDDFLNLEALEIALLHFTGEVDYVCFRARVFREFGMLTKAWKTGYFDPPFLGLVDGIDEAVIRGTNVHIWNKIYRREVIDRHRVLFPDGLLYEDFTFNLAYLLVSRQAFYLNERLYNYRQRPNSTMSQTRLSSFDRAADHLSVVMELFKFMRDRGLLVGRESFLADYFVKYFRLTCRYAPAEKREEIFLLAGQRLQELEASFHDKSAVFMALLRGLMEDKRKINQIIISFLLRLRRKLGEAL